MSVDSRAGSVTLSDNLSEATGGTETVTGDSRLATGFATDASSYDLTSVTLRLSRVSIGGQLELRLYSDAGLEPGTLIGTLNGPGSISSGPADVTFTASGVSLAAMSNYWLVLNTTDGIFTSDTDSDGVEDGEELLARLAINRSHATASYNIYLDLANGNGNGDDQGGTGGPPGGGGPPLGGGPPPNRWSMPGVSIRARIWLILATAPVALSPWA